MINKYSHLQNVKQIKYDWRNNMMRKALPDKAFQNQLTSNILLSMQAILAKGFGTADYIKKYFRF